MDKEIDNSSINEETVQEKMSTDQVLTNLKIISQIKKGEKIVTNSSILEIDNRYFQSVRRWWQQNSRISTIDFFNKVIDRSFEIIDTTYNEKEKDNYYFNEENSRILQKFSLEMTNSCKGLSNLKETYTNDVTTTSQIDIMIEKIKGRVEKIQKIMTIQGTFPKNKKE
jgi:hypothetical protein